MQNYHYHKKIVTVYIYYSKFIRVKLLFLFAEGPSYVAQTVQTHGIASVFPLHKASEN